MRRLITYSTCHCRGFYVMPLGSLSSLKKSRKSPHKRSDIPHALQKICTTNALNFSPKHNWKSAIFYIGVLAVKPKLRVNQPYILYFFHIWNNEYLPENNEDIFLKLTIAVIHYIQLRVTFFWLLDDNILKKRVFRHNWIDYNTQRHLLVCTADIIFLFPVFMHIWDTLWKVLYGFFV